MGDFVVAARLDELKEEIGVCVTVGDTRVALFRLGDEVFAINNVCPHEGGPLADGFVDGHNVLCPLHAWEFDLHTGRVIGGTESVARYPVRIEGNDVLVDVVGEDGD